MITIDNVCMYIIVKQKKNMEDYLEFNFDSKFCQEIWIDLRRRNVTCYLISGRFNLRVFKKIKFKKLGIE